MASPVLVPKGGGSFCHRWLSDFFTWDSDRIVAFVASKSMFKPQGGHGLALATY